VTVEGAECGIESSQPEIGEKTLESRSINKKTRLA